TAGDDTHGRRDPEALVKRGRDIMPGLIETDAYIQIKHPVADAAGLARRDRIDPGDGKLPSAVQSDRMPADPYGAHGSACRYGTTPASAVIVPGDDFEVIDAVAEGAHHGGLPGPNGKRRERRNPQHPQSFDELRQIGHVADELRSRHHGHRKRAVLRI